MGEQGQTRGYRVYLIREALGTRRDPLPLPKFAELIERASGVVYDKSTLSRMETGERKVSVEDIEAIAPVDPLKRGKAWLAGWDDEDNGGSEVASEPVAPTELPRTPWRETHREILPPIQRTAPTKKRRPKDDRTARAS